MAILLERASAALIKFLSPILSSTGTQVSDADSRVAEKTTPKKPASKNQAQPHIQKDPPPKPKAKVRLRVVQHDEAPAEDPDPSPDSALEQSPPDLNQRKQTAQDGTEDLAANEKSEDQILLDLLTQAHEKSETGQNRHGKAAYTAANQKQRATGTFKKGSMIDEEA